MSKDPSPLIFQPAPRPQSRLSGGDAERLAEAAADLGFSRASSPPQVQDAAPPALAPKTRLGPRPTTAQGQTALKIEVPDGLWTSLKLEAVRRRVTVKFLILEALARQGFDIDLNTVAEDGRRLR